MEMKEENLNNNVKIICTRPSASFKAIGANLGIKAIRPNPAESKFRASKKYKVINWGCSEIPEHVQGATIINEEEAVKVAVNKRSFLEAVKDHCAVPEFCNLRNIPAAWMENAAPNRPFAVARTILTGSGGKGIELLFTKEDLNKLKPETLVTRYFPKKEEYRIHVMGDKEFFVQKKVRNLEVENPNWFVRNHDNGFKFASGPEFVKDTPKVVIDEAIKAVQAVGLAFGAVDVAYNLKHNRACVLEVNTAPGMEGERTINAYVGAFAAFLGMKGIDAELAIFDDNGNDF
jgi:glutathione synthase/RimK-type ligase-like ATP-grasp enzyme